MSNSTAKKPAAQHVSYRDLFSPQSSTHGSSNSLSTVIDSLPRSSHFEIPPLVSITEDQTTKHHQLPNSCFEGDPFGIFSRNAGSTNALQYPSYGHLDHQTSSVLPQFVLIDSLRRICTTCALKFYHSLLPPPTVYVTVHQDHPESHDSGSHPHFKAMTEYFPNHSPQTALVCGEALSVTRAANEKLPLTQILNLISHANHDGGAAGHQQQVELQVLHVARMAELWGWATRLLMLLDHSSQGLSLGFPDLCSAYGIAEEFCDQLGDEHGLEEVGRAWRAYNA
jgi:hypothetical protein